jgi:hypothetical protein
MKVGQFFKKVSSGTKDFFKKGGIAESGFRKLGNTLSQTAPVVKEIGKVASSIAEPLKSVPVIGDALSAGARAVGKYAPKASGAINNIGKKQKEILNIARENQGDISAIATKSLEATRTRGGIQAPKPQVQPWNAFDELPFA